jgi:hypothetical protein
MIKRSLNFRRHAVKKKGKFSGGLGKIVGENQPESIGVDLFPFY